MKIRTKVLLIICFISLFILVSMTINTWHSINSLSDYAVNVSEELGENLTDGASDLLIEQANQYLQILAREQAKGANSVLNDIRLNIDLLKGVTSDIFENPQYLNGRPIVNPGDAVEGVYKSTYVLADQYEMTPEMERHLELLSNLDLIMPTLSKDPNVIELYVALTSSLFYNYTELTLENSNYDPCTRPWYKQAMATPDEVVFTDIYEDAFGTGMVMTAASTFSDKNGEILGVVGLDIQLEALKQLVLSTRISETGYVFILDQTGRYIVHPEMGLEGFSAYPLEDEKSNVRKAFREAYISMMNGEEGCIEGYVGRQRVFLAYSPISVTGWSVGVIVPESEILSALRTLTKQLESFTENSENDLANMTRTYILMLFAIVVITIALMIIFAPILTKIISNPIDSLIEDVALIGNDIEYRMESRRDDEIGSLKKAFNKMAEQICENMEELAAVTAAQERIDSELRMASQIQSDMLAEIRPKMAGNPYVDVYAFVEPALEMGGDLYDLFFIDENEKKLCIVIADVSGKGMPAAMFMLISKTLIRDYADIYDDPAKVLEMSNNRLCEDNPNNVFVTVFLAFLDLETGSCKYASAGHNPVLYAPAGEPFKYIDAGQYVPLGIFPNSKYESYSTVIPKGGRAFLYTDGITEALDTDSVEWGEESLLEAVNRSAESSAETCEELAHRVREDVRAHAGGALQSDDITVIALKFNGAGSEYDAGKE